MISVLLPVFNEEAYLVQCLESILAQEEADFEICISDNASTDDTWEIITRYSQIDSRIKPLRQKQAVHPFENLRNTLNRATGDYVYMIGGDDYLLPGFFKEALKIFKHEPALQAVLVRMHYFSDRDGSILATLPPPEFDLRLNTSASELVRFLLKNINHDEIIIGVFDRMHFNYIMALLIPSSQESLGIWGFWGAALQGKKNRHRVRITHDVYLMKRFEKPDERNSSYSKSAERYDSKASSQYLTSCLRSRGSIVNAIRFYKAGLFGWREMLSVLLAPRFVSTKKSGERVWITNDTDLLKSYKKPYELKCWFYEAGPLINPVLILLIYPIRKIRNVVLGLSDRH